MTRLGVVVAMAAEARTLGLSGCSGDVTPSAISPRILVCLSGIGAERAAIAATRLLEAGATALLSWGTAAALCADARPGQLLLPQTVLQADGRPLPVATAWQRQLAGFLAASRKIIERPLIASARVLTDPAQKLGLQAVSGAVATDMESAAVAMIAERAGVPFVALRAVADSVATSVPAWIMHRVDEYGRPRTASLLPELLLRPVDWPALLRINAEFRMALRTLRSIGAPQSMAQLLPAWQRPTAAADMAGLSPLR